jgi:hypothetical protein
MQSLLILLAFFLPTPSLAGEELYTIQIDHWENRKVSQFAANNFAGRRWDLQSLLARANGRGSIEILRQLESTTNSSHSGHSYCVRIQQRWATHPERRAIYLKNFLKLLGLRQTEMLRAGAHFRVHYPSTCAERGLKIRPAWIANGAKP